jgi:hypothetical protein
MNLKVSNLKRILEDLNPLASITHNHLHFFGQLDVMNDSYFRKFERIRRLFLVFSWFYVDIVFFKKGNEEW